MGRGVGVRVGVASHGPGDRQRMQAARRGGPPASLPPGGGAASGHPDGKAAHRRLRGWGPARRRGLNSGWAARRRSGCPGCRRGRRRSGPGEGTGGGRPRPTEMLAAASSCRLWPHKRAHCLLYVPPQRLGRAAHLRLQHQHAAVGAEGRGGNALRPTLPPLQRRGPALPRAWHWQSDGVQNGAKTACRVLSAPRITLVAAGGGAAGAGRPGGPADTSTWCRLLVAGVPTVWCGLGEGSKRGRGGLLPHKWPPACRAVVYEFECSMTGPIPTAGLRRKGCRMVRLQTLNNRCSPEIGDNS